MHRLIMVPVPLWYILKENNIYLRLIAQCLKSFEIFLLLSLYNVYFKSIQWNLSYKQTFLQHRPFCTYNLFFIQSVRVYLTSISSILILKIIWVYSICAIYTPGTKINIF